MKACSLDLRERVAVACGQTGQIGRQVAVRFSVSVSFVEKRLHRQRTSGSLKVPAAQRLAPCLDTPAHVGLGLTRCRLGRVAGVAGRAGRAGRGPRHAGTSGAGAGRVAKKKAFTADNCTVASVTNDAPAVFPKGTTTITWTMKGSAGNTATDLQTVTINDTEKPTITVPSAVTATTNTACTATGVMLGTPVTADNCAVKSVSNDAPTAFSLGATTVTDSSNSTATATQTVTVNDTEKPVLTVPAALVSSAPAAQYDVAIFFAPTDNCAGTTGVVSLASGSTFPWARPRST